MTVQATEVHEIEHRIEEAATATEALAREFFGDAAYWVRRSHEDRETGCEQVVFEIHYCFEDPESGFDRLSALHQAFTDAFVRMVTPEVQSLVILAAVPTDGD